MPLSQVTLGDSASVQPLTSVAIIAFELAGHSLCAERFLVPANTVGADMRLGLSCFCLPAASPIVISARGLWRAVSRISSGAAGNEVFDSVDGTLSSESAEDLRFPNTDRHLRKGGPPCALCTHRSKCILPREHSLQASQRTQPLRSCTKATWETHQSSHRTGCGLALGWSFQQMTFPNVLPSSLVLKCQLLASIGKYLILRQLVFRDPCSLSEKTLKRSSSHIFSSEHCLS